ncbi:hypothetical protein [Prauserella cavernicola]|uniref:Uncharacterized protein n=1 Tax=Prauserella cavernicola TaxID=2800127 RepID=A0A934QQI6_9PSEU|nr:hypothetical protein [Prauserella cavernicola]MBK1783638.1 hypothetical protein [Prauserella cavernicola]
MRIVAHDDALLALAVVRAAALAPGRSTAEIAESLVRSAATARTRVGRLLTTPVAACRHRL